MRIFIRYTGRRGRHCKDRFWIVSSQSKVRWNGSKASPCRFLQGINRCARKHSAGRDDEGVRQSLQVTLTQAILGGRRIRSPKRPTINWSGGNDQRHPFDSKSQTGWAAIAGRLVTFLSGATKPAAEGVGAEGACPHPGPSHGGASPLLLESGIESEVA